MTIFKTLGRYMAKRFVVTILAVFFFTFLLIFFVDFIENLRRGASRDDIGALTMATISLLRVPIFAELALPFAVLIGTIGAFLGLSRSSELTIVRAAGLSVWQFLQPGLGLGSALACSRSLSTIPLASAEKAESERMQTELFDTKKTFGTPADRLLAEAGGPGWADDSPRKNRRRPGTYARRRDPVAI